MKKWRTGIMAIGMANVLYSQTTINLNELSKHVGDSVQVEGKVYSTRYLPD
jgi:hypothetical protein